MPLLVKVQHQPGQGAQGVGIGPMIVLELRAMGRPDGQLMLQLLLARLNAAAHLRQPRLAPQGFPLLPCGRHGRGTMSPPDTCKCLIFTHVVLLDFILRFCFRKNVIVEVREVKGNLGS